MINKKSLYANSWEIYKTHTEGFTDDFDYYAAFCRGKKTLELFAGYGRLTKHLVQLGVDIECVELEPNFKRFINLPEIKIHICNVLHFKPTQQYERIIAGYNSFCLLTSDKDISRFFSLLSEWLTPGGKASLSYFDHNMWKNSPSYSFNFKNTRIHYTPNYDLSKIGENKGTWIDEYKDNMTNLIIKHEYPVKLYKEDKDIEQFLKNTQLTLVDKIFDYNKNNLDDSGWIEYVFQKND